MVHPDDWAVLLRAPSFETTMGWVVWLTITGPLTVAMLISLVRWPKDRRVRPILWTLGAIVSLLTAWGAYAGFEVRRVQAACWRAGPDALPERWQEYCREIPPQHVEGLYNDGLAMHR